MGLLEKIFFRDWPQPHKGGLLLDLTLDLSAGALGQFSINGSTGKLKELLGAPANWKRWKYRQQWHYPEFGVWFDSSKEGILEGIYIIVREEASYSICPGWKERLKPWTGTIRFERGNRLSALAATKEDFIKLVGEPEERDDDPEDPEFMYTDSTRFRDFGFDVEFTAKGELSGLDIYSTR
jgi:hypothetical protein